MKVLEDSLGSFSYLLALPLLYRQEGTLTVVWAGLPQAYSPPTTPGQLWNEVAAMSCWLLSGKLILMNWFLKIDSSPWLLSGAAKAIHTQDAPGSHQQ